MKKLNPLEWAVRPLKRYADFSGRSPRAEYWWYVLIVGTLGGLLGALDARVAPRIVGIYGPLALLSMLVFTVPGVAVDIRRLHDINRSGWWWLLNLWSYVFVWLQMAGSDFASLLKQIPITFAILLVVAMVGCFLVKFVFMVTPGTEGLNRYGPDPYGPDQLEEVFA